MLLLETLSSNRMLHSMNFGTSPPTPKKIILNWSVMLEIGSTDLIFDSDPKPLFLGEGINQRLQGIFNFFHLEKNLST
jgi:hypothetical protein